MARAVAPQVPSRRCRCKEMRPCSAWRLPMAPCSVASGWANSFRCAEGKEDTMLDSIFVGTTGLLGYQQGLRVIANNTANMNTPGYKSSTLGFADLFYAQAPGRDGRAVQLGQGLDTTGTHLDFSQG